MTENPNRKDRPFTWLHVVVLLAGGAVFVLLLLADKTHLQGKEKAPASPMMAMTAPAADTTAPASAPPFEGSPRGADLLGKAEADSVPTDTLALAVEQMVMERRSDLAMPLAQRLVERDSSVRNLLVLGAISRNTLSLDWVKSDQAAYARNAQLAISTLERAERQAPKDEDVKIELGLAYVESHVQENSMKGIFKLREVLEINPKNAEAAYQLGLLSMETGQYDKAEARFRTVLELQPEFLPARYNLALCLGNLGRIPDAKAEMEKLKAQQEMPELAAAASQWLSDHH